MPLGADDDDTGAIPRASPPARAGVSAAPRPTAPRPVAPSVAPKKADTSDVYEAETRVGSMPAEILDALREQGLDQRDAQHSRPTAPPPARVLTDSPAGPIPRAYIKDADDDDDDAATRVHKDGKKIALGSFEENVETQFQVNPLQAPPSARPTAPPPVQNGEVITSPANPLPPRLAPPLPHLGGTLTLSAKAPTPPITTSPPPPAQPSPTQTAPALPVPTNTAPANTPSANTAPPPFVPPPPAFIAQASAPVLASFEPPPLPQSFSHGQSSGFPPPAPAPGPSPFAANNYPSMNPTYPPPVQGTNPSFGPELGPGPISNKHWILIVALSFVITLAVLGVVISRLL